MTRTTTGSSRRPPLDVDLLERIRVFFFFSNRLGCLGSLLISVVLTLVIIALLRR